MNLEHLSTLLWLRWRLTRNQWRRSGRFNAILTMVAVIVGLSTSVVGAVGGVVGGFFLARQEAMNMLIVWDILVGVFLVMWSAGVVSELQRSEIIDLSRLMHLPVALRDAFFLNYLASHLSFSLAMVLPGALGLWIGLVLGRGPTMLLVLPALCGFFFMITAWTYCLRGWLAALMVNPRRRRFVVAAITLAFVLIAQMPNLIFNVWLRGRPHSTPKTAQDSTAAKRDSKAIRQAKIEKIHEVVPFLWLPLGVKSLAEGRALPVLLGGAGMILIGAAGLHRAYRSTVRFYQGGESRKLSKTPAPVSAPRGMAAEAGALGKVRWMERRLPLASEEVSALALAGLRSISRAPEAKMALFMNFFIFVMLGAGIVFRSGRQVPPEVRAFIPAGATILTFLGVLQLQFNVFGFDREGFRALVLAPVRRRDILLGKNLALLPMVGSLFAVFLLLIGILVRLSPYAWIEGVLLFFTGFLGLSVAGNVASILAPFRMAAGSLKPTRTQAKTSFMLVAAAMLIPVALTPLLVPAAAELFLTHVGFVQAPFVRRFLALLLLGAAFVLYAVTLGPLGNLLHRREKEILKIVTEEVE